MSFAKIGSRLFDYTYIAVIAGVLIGSLAYIVFFHNHVFVLDDDLENYKLSGVLTLSKNQLILYIFRRRIVQLLLYLICIFIFSYFSVTSVYCFAFGIYYGIAVTGFLLKLGINSLLYVNFCFFPHFIFYFVSICLCGKWFFSSKDKNFKLEKYKKLVEIVKLSIIISFIFIGCIWECFFQKNILNFFTNI